MAMEHSIRKLLREHAGAYFQNDEIEVDGTPYYFHYLYESETVAQCMKDFGQYLSASEVIFSGNGCGDEYAVDMATGVVTIFMHEYEFKRTPVHSDFVKLIELLGPEAG
jgi:hypothetical protein